MHLLVILFPVFLWRTASACLPWHNGGLDCPLFEDQKEQFEIYRKTYLKYMRSGQNTLSAERFSALMAADLLWLNETFGPIFAFEDQINEFPEYAGECEYQAMWIALKDFALDAQPNEPVHFEPWSRMDTQARFLSPRWDIKDLLAIFENEALRKHVFGVYSPRVQPRRPVHMDRPPHFSNLYRWRIISPVLHNSTAAWYQVDRRTAKGTDIITGDVIELANSPVELRIDFAPENLQPDEYTEYIATVRSTRPGAFSRLGLF